MGWAGSGRGALMAYFPNGTAGDLYQEQYCNRCVHDRESKCPIWGAHLLFNRGPAWRQVLDYLIPMGDNGEPGECQMFAVDEEYKAGQQVDQKYFDWMRERGKS
jgi:hypothetical protein